jgi:hypothetical protein
MSTLLAIAGFEFRSRLKLISTWVYFLIFFAVCSRTRPLRSAAARSPSTRRSH